MIKAIAWLTLALLGWLLARCAVTVWFCNGEYQAFVLGFVVAAVWVDIFVCKWLAQRSANLLEQAKARDCDASRAHWVYLSALGMSVLASPFCASVVSIFSESAVGERSEFHGAVSINEALALPDDDCFEAPEADAYIWYLGAVEYTVTRRVEKFYYAAPFESATWDKSQEVRIWAIVDERELTNGVLTENRVACRVPPRNMHYAAFRTAVANAESRFDLKSADNAILVRLTETAESTSNPIGGPTFWMVMLYGLALIPALLYPVLFGLAPRVSKNQLANARVLQSNVDTNPLVSDSSPKELRKRAAAGKRRFWLGWHVVGFIPLSVVMVTWLPEILSLLLVFVIPAIEIWLLLRAFTDAETRRSLRMAVACVMPLAMFFALTLVNVGKFGMNESARFDANQRMTDIEPASPATIVRMPEDFQLEPMLSGEYWAPNEETKTWRVVPLVPKNETLGQPIKYWVKSTDRLDSRFQQEPIRFVRIDQQSASFQYQQAIADAEYHHEVVAAETPILLEPVVDPERQSQDAVGFVLLGFLGICLSWATAAMFWPGSPSR